MKKSQLRKLVQEAIQEILNEEEVNIDVPNPNALTNTQMQALINQARNASKDPTLGTAKKPVNFFEVSKLKEMSRPAISYDLSDDYANKLSELPYINSDKRMKWVNGIIEYIKDNGPADITKIASKKFNLPQPRIADYARDMIRLGILVPAKEGVIPQFMKPKPEPGEEIEPETADTGIVDKDLSDEEIDASFAKTKAAGGEEDFDKKVIQRVGGEKVSPLMTSVNQNAVKFFDDNDRLLKKLIDAFSASKIKIREIDDNAGDFKQSEKARKVSAQSQIDDLVNQMANKIKEIDDEEVRQKVLSMLAFKLDSVGYSSLYKKITQKIGTSVAPLDEWTISRMQYYAGIKK